MSETITYYKARTEHGIEFLTSDEIDILDEVGSKVKILRKATYNETKKILK